MVKTLAACAALCIAAVAFLLFHEAVATDASHVGVRNAAIDGPGVAPSWNDGDAERQAAAAQSAGKPPIGALGVANAGWSDLFNH